MLEVKQLQVGYGESNVVHQVSLQVEAGEAVALMGRNGMGKTTLLKAIVGMLPAKQGSITLDGRSLAGLPSYQRVRCGMAFVPQGRMIFPQLTVEENLLVAMDRNHARTKTVPGYVHAAFPVLAEMRHRKGGNLSGGQQQMLAIARALVSNPQVLILDEPTEGIQPSIIKDMARILNLLRRERGFALLVSEQVLSFALDLADRFLVIDRGRIVHEEYRATLDRDKVSAFLTV
ncbi:urea ABC transporter ATP-binding subunit UrtE [Comamonas sp. GB3 AK4-5]|uniref:urea ABC transporter ATP-binding subunit UrtE n=1 Tax=Comamonas sp. GB3 AK4-5 TaxID=3231487 RepID=UPI00351EF2D7